ncbi:MAG: thioredoxin family protein [Thalassotalea sp.]
MKLVTLFFTLIFSLAYCISSVSVAAGKLPLYSQHYDDQRNPFDDAKNAIKLAAATKRNVLIEIGGTWCGWCSKMEQFLVDNPKVAEALHNNFVVLKVSVSDANENAEFMKSLPPVLGYPHMYVSTATGKMLLSKDTAELLEGEEYSVNNWLEFIEQWQPQKSQG